MASAVGTVKEVTPDNKLVIKINKDYPQGRLIAKMLEDKLPVKYYLAGAADGSMIIERDINDPSATITEAQLKCE